jgi:hypothetical protein
VRQHFKDLEILNKELGAQDKEKKIEDARLRV